MNHILNSTDLGIKKVDALQPGVEEGLAADSTLAALGQHVAQLWVVTHCLTQVRVPAAGVGDSQSGVCML